MSHAFDAASAAAEPIVPAAPRPPGALGALGAALQWINRLIMVLCGLALIIACLVLTYSVVVRYWLRIPTDWQDETAVFLIVGATFFSAAAVQARRGHVSIELLASFMSPALNRVRLFLADAVSLAFCTFFSWKSWTLLHEALVDGQTSSSSWAPPLWIPYSLMSAGMTLLSLQILLQIAEFVTTRSPRAAGRADPKIGLGARPVGSPQPQGVSQPQGMSVR